jgi:hypothetical protein
MVYNLNLPWQQYAMEPSQVISHVNMELFNPPPQDGVRMSPLGMLATTWSTVPALDDDEDDRQV